LKLAAKATVLCTGSATNGTNWNYTVPPYALVTPVVHNLWLAYPRWYVNTS
jgi:hypothetical protein